MERDETASPSPVPRRRRVSSAQGTQGNRPHSNPIRVAGGSTIAGAGSGARERRTTYEIRYRARFVRQKT